ncbi:MAG: hypothetical protein M3O02_08730, partial [Acidobacteriota bacterium]|nr:hypothetical protein [Acidobacteriota bacterium]
MHLWNDYEGKTIAGGYTLGTLIRPEGRSALFTLPGGPDGPAIIRITESLNDEGQMLACWRRIAEVKQENLLAVRHFGETVFEGTPITYAVLEATEANLDELIQQRALTQAEALELAASLTAALSALHGSGFVHEHVDAVNVFAVGEAIKLRADCAREIVVDHEFVTAQDHARLVQQDIRDLAEVLLRALTLERKITPATVLPAPFDRILPQALKGTCTLPQIAAAVAPPAAPPLPWAGNSAAAVASTLPLPQPQT